MYTWHNLFLVTPGGFKSQSVSSTVEAYKEYLKCTYNNKKLPGDDKWQCPLDCIKHFVNLKYIDIKSQLQRKEIEKSWDIIIKGSLDHYNLYKTTREQIDISRIACRIDDSLPNLVILNGDPGIGKTTLSWELCRRWSRGELWTEYSLVVLLQLRDENVQAATGIYDLFQFSDAGIPPSAETDVLSTHVQGAKILFILEGLDELPRKIREDKNSFLIKLIAGRVLPASTVVVTTRPWAVADLPSSCSSRLDQFIDILGFTQGQVREYISKMIADREAPAELQAFLDANPHISSAMCSPLLAHIVVNVYKQCFVREDAVFPNTTTELYTAYCRVLVERHLTDNPVEEEWNGELWNLPQSIQPRFNFLCEIAYQGITKEKQQLVFYKEDFPNAKATLGFMNSVHPLHQSATERVCPSYDFIHTTLQEFLAAIYIWKNHSPQKQLILFETACIDRRYKRILRFLAGLTKLGDPWTRCVLPVPTLMGASISTIKECEFSVESVMWLYESQNTELINEYEGVAMSAPLHCAGLKYYTALGHLIGTGNFQVLFQVFSTSSRSYEDFVDFTAINNLALALRKHKTCSSLLKRISLSSNALNNDSVNFLLQCIQPTASPGPVLCVMFSSKVSRKDAFTSDSSTKFIQSVEEIELFPQDYIRIKQTNYDLLSRLSEILKTKSNLKKLKLTCTKDLESKNRELSEIIMHSQSFQTLELRLPENKFTSSFYRQSWIKLGLKMLNLQCLRSRLLPSELFSVLDLNDKFSRQQSAVRSLQSLTRDLEYLEWDSFEVSDVDQLSSFFQTVFACSALERLTINEFSESTSQGHQLRDVSRLQLDGLSAHPSLQRVELAYFPGLGCLIFSSLQQNKSVKYLNITVDFEDDGITDVFGALLAHNKSLTAICLNAHSIYTCRNALVATLEHVSTATSLKGFSIKFSNHLFDDSISSAICKILKNVNIERLGIPLFLPPQKSFLEIFAKALCENSTLQILILRHSKYQPLAHVHPIPVDLPRTTVSGEEAEALGEMLKVNKSLEIIHLLAEFSDCSPLVRGLAVNNTIQEFQIDRSTKESAIKCPDYHLARKKMVFLCEAMLAMQNCQESRGVQYKRFF